MKHPAPAPIAEGNSAQPRTVGASAGNAEPPHKTRWPSTVLRCSRPDSGRLMMTDPNRTTNPNSMTAHQIFAVFMYAEVDVSDQFDTGQEIANRALAKTNGLIEMLRYKPPSDPFPEPPLDIQRQLDLMEDHRS